MISVIIYTTCYVKRKQWPISCKPPPYLVYRLNVKIIFVRDESDYNYAYACTVVCTRRPCPSYIIIFLLTYTDTYTINKYYTYIHHNDPSSAKSTVIPWGNLVHWPLVTSGKINLGIIQYKNNHTVTRVHAKFVPAYPARKGS